MPNGYVDYQGVKNPAELQLISEAIRLAAHQLPNTDAIHALNASLLISRFPALQLTTAKRRAAQSVQNVIGQIGGCTNLRGELKKQMWGVMHHYIHID